MMKSCLFWGTGGWWACWTLGLGVWAGWWGVWKAPKGYLGILGGRNVKVDYENVFFFVFFEECKEIRRAHDQRVDSAVMAASKLRIGLNGRRGFEGTR
jgi:hypothetical protein